MDSIAAETHQERESIKNAEKVCDFAISVQHEIYRRNKELKVNNVFVYRKINLSQKQLDCFTEAIQTECPIWFESFTSTSKNKEVALRFQGNSLLEIEIREKGVIDCYPIDIQSLSVFPQEEVLFKMQSSFKVMSSSYSERTN